jgi:hypothetical protein
LNEKPRPNGFGSKCCGAKIRKERALIVWVALWSRLRRNDVRKKSVGPKKGGAQAKTWKSATSGIGHKLQLGSMAGQLQLGLFRLTIPIINDYF